MGRVCGKAGCWKLAEDAQAHGGRKGRYCEEHRRERERQESADRREYDRERGNRHDRGYDSRWVAARKGFLAKHRWCVDCEKLGQHVPATEVDHDPPHGGDMKKFWDRSTWFPRCKSHHSSKTRRETNARTGRQSELRGSDVCGKPLDPDHPWNT